LGIIRKIANGSESTGLSNHIDRLNSDYKVNLLGDNYMQIEKDRKLIHIVNSQAVRLSEESEKIKILIIEDNKCEDQKSLSESLDYLKEPLFTIIPKKLSQHKGPENIENARRALLKYANLYDAFVGYDAQAGTNQDMLEITQLRKPYVSVSNKHNFSGCGACIEIPNMQMNTSNEYSFLKSLKDSISSGSFSSIEELEGFISRALWKMTFLWGTRKNKHHSYKP
jgi:hypothetical protein